MDGDPTRSRTKQRLVHQETFARFKTAEWLRKCHYVKHEESEQSLIACRQNVIAGVNKIMSNSSSNELNKTEDQDPGKLDLGPQIAPLRLKEDAKSTLTCYHKTYKRAQQIVARSQIKLRSAKKLDHENENENVHQSGQWNELKITTYPFRESSQLSTCHNNCKKESNAANYSGRNNDDDISIENRNHWPKLRHKEEEDSSEWGTKTCRRKLSYNFCGNYVKKAIKSKSNNNKCLFFHRNNSNSNNHNRENENEKLLDSLKSNSNSNSNSISISLKTIVIITIFLLLICGQSLSFAYQLANNLIANNLPPKFITSQAGQASNSEIVVRVKEGAASIGKLIFTLKGEDPDDDPLTFGVLGSTASDLLRIENVPGNQANVYLRKELDRETTESYQVVITLTDGKLGRGNWITKSMLIIVEDVNDNYPVFGPHKTAISVREDAQTPMVIETVEATDHDEGRFGQVIYKLDEVDDGKGSTSNMFSIETIDGKGVISLISPLDYEQKALYQLRILAIDRAIEQERLTATTSILISVEDCEDKPPMFTFVPSITRVPENLPIGSPIVRVAAIDGDRGINNPIQYKLVSVNGQESGFERNLFNINPETGQINVAHELNRELSPPEMDFWPSATSAGKDQLLSQPGSYVIQVRATEISSISSSKQDNSVTTELTIILTDINDEAPTFNQATYYGEILENSTPENLVTFVTAPSLQHNAHILSYHNQYQPNQHHQQQQDLQQPVAKVVDRDQGTNGTFILYLDGEHSRLFDIWPREATNEANFMIKVSSSQSDSKYQLDFEKSKMFTFNIVAKEKYNNLIGQMKTNTAQMTVFLKDSNDNYPQFESELYKVEIPENAIRGMHICAVKAFDSDSGIYGTQGIRYTEIRGEKANKFKLDPITGVITLKTNDHGFDRETIAQHHLIVEARDSNGSGNRNTTQLLIILTDVNDQKPKFLLDQYEAFIYENELDFQSPLQVQAIDNDAPNTQNSRITYSIIAGDPQQNFTIDPQTGRIKVKSSLVINPKQSQLIGTFQGETDVIMESGGSIGNGALQSGAYSPTNQVTGLDFERIAQKRDDTRQFNLTIKATDSGLPESLSDQTNVIILVYDKNDHAPVFTRNIYSKSIREDAKEGSQVLQVLAQDGDHSPTNSKITYRISSGASDKFVIDSDSGLISVANGANLDIDRVVGGQKRTNYLLNVIAFDGSFGPNQKSSSALVNITIIDVNNKPPEFITLGATRQQSSNSQQSQSSSSSATSGSGLTSLTNQQLMVVNVNEDAPYGLIVTKVVAIDLDSSAELRYSINYARSEGRNEDMVLVEPSFIKDIFAIEPTDGTIKVAKQLDRELFDQVKLRLQVEDIAAQTSDQIAHSYLLIKITDVNDNRPVFKKPLYKAVVNENSISGTSVITLTADDRDLNKTLKYSLDGTPEMTRLIRINPRSGEITVNDKIDREMYPMINVTVKAEDYGYPHPLIGTTQLLITVRDENDNNPIFLNSSQNQLTNSGDIIFSKNHPSFRQYQNDLSSYNTLRHDDTYPKNHNMNDSTTYRLRSLNPYRSIDSSTPFDGSLSTPTIPTTTTTTIMNGINLESGSHNHRLPLLSPGATAKIREDAPIGYQIAYVKAEDADVGNNGRVTYLIDSASSGGKFRIDRDSGIISVAGPLDRETNKQFSLIIEACDNYDLGYSNGESRRAFTQVNIQITDTNDNAPIITTNLQTSTSSMNQVDSFPERISGMFPTYDDIMNSPGPYEQPLADCLFISEFQQLNEPILTITAIDADDPNLPNGQMDLAIVNNLPQNELFGLVNIPSNRLQQQNSDSTTTATRDYRARASESITSPPISGGDLTGFGELNLGESNPSGVLTATSSVDFNTRDEIEAQLSSKQHQQQLRPKRSSDTEAGLTLDPASISATENFYSPIASSAQSLGSFSILGPQQIIPNARQRRPVSSRALGSASLASSVTSGNSIATTDSSLAGDLVMSATMSSVRHHANSLNLDGGEQQVHLVINRSLKERVGNYSIVVRATDRATPSLSSIKIINICVQDVNNHSPVFLRPPLNHTIRVMENATIGTYVSQVEATDADHGINGELQYSLKQQTNIQNNNDWQSFKIDRLTGVITTAKQFNRQLKKYYTLRVQAQDFGKPTPLSSDIDINIMIVNSGQYQPEFEIQTQTLQFTENVAPGIEWFTLLSTNNLDDDPALINANNPAPHQPQSQSQSQSITSWLTSPCYFIIDSDDHDQMFHLDRYTHRLSNQRPIDREKKANYTLLVQATNNCNKSPAAPIYTRTLEIASRLSSPNQLTSSSTSPIDYRSSDGGLSNEAKTRSARATINNDQYHNRDKKSIDQSHYNNNQTSNRLTTIKSAELVSAHQEDGFNQAAVDTLISSDKSLLKVFIKVKDVNDNAPKFTQKVYTGGITTEADFGTVFMIVQAVDADADINSQVVYSIVKPVKQNLVTFSSSSSSSSSSSGSNSLISNKSNLSRGSTDSNQSANSLSFRSKRAADPQMTIQSSSRQQVSLITTTTTAAASQSITTLNSNLTTKTSTATSSNNNTIATSSTGIQRQFDDNFMNNDIPMNEEGDLFVIHPQTGEISLNFDPQKHMKGYFEFEILANDTEGLFDSAKVFIYLLRQDQRVKFVLRLTPQELRQRLNKFRSVFGNITGAIVNIDSYKYYENHDGTVDKKKTSLYLHFVNPDDNTIIDVDKVLTLIDNNIEYLDELYKEFHVLSSEAAHLPLSSSALIDPIDQIRTGLMGIASFLALILVLVIALCLNQRTRYERQLKAATVSAFGSSPLHLDPDFHSQTNLPNTNLHSQDPNPIWMNGYGEQDWLSGGSNLIGAVGKANGGGACGNGSNGLLGNVMNGHRNNSDIVVMVGRGGSVGRGGIEDGDYLSSENSDINSLSGVNSVSQLHYNATATATPRDSLNSSHGRVSGSGSGSTSTTNDRQALCRNNNNSNSNVARQAPQQLQRAEVHHHGYNQQQTTGTLSRPSKELEVIGVLKNGIKPSGGVSSKENQVANSVLKKRSHQNDLAGSHSTFGAFKEVTIYTDHDQQALQSQFSAATATTATATQQQQKTNNNLIRTVDHTNQQQQQQQPTSQVNKIASQFNAKHQAQRINNQTGTNQVYVGQASQQQQQHQHQQQHQQQHQHQHQHQHQQQVAANRPIQHRIIVHANGADVNQGIIKTSATNSTTTAIQPLSSMSQNNKQSNNKQFASINQRLTEVDSPSIGVINNQNNTGNGIIITQQQNHNTNYKIQQQHVSNGHAADAFETNLSKLSILNLETTEL